MIITMGRKFIWAIPYKNTYIIRVCQALTHWDGKDNFKVKIITGNELEIRDFDEWIINPDEKDIYLLNY